ncbi:molecular chaperone DnaJ [Pendulispora brunnea]|uniref:Chaperone protein DnaJ n=1 Tax=Pendulispora brunnea TaxID=2905690 RepID=A0ABZ2JZR7_9BACT
MSKRCYYEVLGCSKDASAEELRRAYKKEALKHHPDRNQGNPRAEQTFKEVNEAYQVLSDEQKRRIYDQFGFAGLEGAASGGPGDMGDVFSHMQDLFAEMFSGGPFGFGGNRAPRRGGDLRVQQRLSLRDAAFGCKREVVVHAPSRCDDCSGSGAAAGSKPEACSACRGTGQVSTARGFVMFTAPCARCQGRGQVIRNVCKSCKGEGVIAKPRKVTVNFPAGIDSGQRLRVQGQGMPGPGNVPPGDLYVEVDVEEDSRFERDGTDLVTRVNVGFVDAALGAEVRVPSIGPETENGEEPTLTVSIPAGTQSGAVFTLKGQGIPRLDGRGRGCLIVVVQVQVPTALTSRARELLTMLDEELRLGAEDAEGVSRRRVAASSK